MLKNPHPTDKIKIPHLLYTLEDAKKLLKQEKIAHKYKVRLDIKTMEWF